MTTGNVPARNITRGEARRRTDAFKAHTEQWLKELVALHDDQVWWALGYADWADYCASEFGSIRLPRGAGRTGAILTLRQASLSIRDIGVALGLGRGTVERELKAVPLESLPDTIVGADGKYYPASTPTPEIEVAVPNGTPAPETEGPTVVQAASEVGEIEVAVPSGTATAETEPREVPETTFEVEDPQPPGAPTEHTPGMTDRVRQALEKAVAKPQEPAVEPEVVEAEVVEAEVAEAEPEPPPPEPKKEPKKKAAEPQPQPPYIRPIDALVDELGVIVAQLERHVESEDFTDLRNRRRHWFTTGASGVIESLSRRLADVTTHLSHAQRTCAEWALLTSAEKCRWGRAYDEGADPVEVMKEVIVWRRVDDNQYVPVRVDTLAANDDLYQEWKREREETKARKRRS